MTNETTNVTDYNVTDYPTDYPYPSVEKAMGKTFKVEKVIEVNSMKEAHEITLNLENDKFFMTNFDFCEGKGMVVIYE